MADCPGRFISEVFGAGVQHIAFAMGDIFPAVERKRAIGVDLLPLPEIDYDNLKARDCPGADHTPR